MVIEVSEFSLLLLSCQCRAEKISVYVHVSNSYGIRTISLCSLIVNNILCNWNESLLRVHWHIFHCLSWAKAMNFYGNTQVDDSYTKVKGEQWTPAQMSALKESKYRQKEQTDKKRADRYFSTQNMYKNIWNFFGHKNINIFSERKAKMSTKNEREQTQKKRLCEHLQLQIRESKAYPDAKRLMLTAINSLLNKSNGKFNLEPWPPKKQVYAFNSQIIRNFFNQAQLWLPCFNKLSYIRLEKHELMIWSLNESEWNSLFKLIICDNLW